MSNRTATLDKMTRLYEERGPQTRDDLKAAASPTRKSPPTAPRGPPHRGSRLTAGLLGGFPVAAAEFNAE